MYVIPAITSILVVPELGYEFSDTGIKVILLSVIMAVFGYVFGTSASRRRQSNYRLGACRSYIRVANSLLVVGVVCAILDFAKIGAIPLFADNEARVALVGSFLWNGYILGAAGLFLLSFCRSKTKVSRMSTVLVVVYLLLALISGWKGTFLNFLLLLMVPRLKGKQIPVFYLAIAIVPFSALFIAVNILRAQATLDDVFAQPLYYIYWGFVNFDSLSLQATSNCIHSVPLIRCKFTVDDGDFLSSTWNVYTALTPLYIDGGRILVGCAFFALGALLAILERIAGSLTRDYLYYLCFYFFYLAHNGYAFYSSSFAVTFIGFHILEYISGARSNRQCRTASAVRHHRPADHDLGFRQRHLDARRV